MKVISILQPWASLAVIGAKKIETRSWNTKYRGPLLIHASAKWTKEQEKLLENYHFGMALGAPSGKIHITTGHIIGKVNLVDTFQIRENHNDHEGISPKSGGFWEFSEKETAFGDYSPGRYGWLLSDPVQFTQPIPAKGKLGLWENDHADTFSILSQL